MATVQEQGTPTVWDAAWREGYATGLEAALGISYRRAWLLARDYWRPAPTWRTKLARWLLTH